jgi:hypothetical protein
MAGLLKLLTLLKDLSPIINQIDPWVRKLGGAGFFILAFQLSMAMSDMAEKMANISDKVTQIDKGLQSLTISVATMIERSQTQKEIILEHSNDLKQIEHRLFIIEKGLK